MGFFAPRMTAEEVAADLTEAADLIRKASALLDRACCRGPRALADKIEAVPGLQHIERSMADALDSLAAEIVIQAEREAAEAEDEAQNHTTTKDAA